MRQFAIIAYFFIYTAFAFGQIANDGLNFFNYSYNRAIIKNSKVETITIEMSFLEGKAVNKSIYYFDNEGLLITQTIQDSEGNLKKEFYFATNSHNDLISRIQKDYEYNRVDTVHYFKSYIGDKLIKDSSREIPISYYYEYSSNGNLVKTTINSNFGLGNNTKRIIIHSHDSLNRIINSLETFFQSEQDSKGTLFSNRDFYYCYNGKVEKEVEKLNSQYSWMANKGSINYAYDNKGNLTQILKDKAASYVYSYNNQGLITTKKMNMKIESDDFINTEINAETFEKFSYTFRQ